MAAQPKSPTHPGDGAAFHTFNGAAFDGTQCVTPPGHGAEFHTFNGAAFDCTTCATPPTPAGTVQRPWGRRSDPHVRRHGVRRRTQCATAHQSMAKHSTTARRSTTQSVQADLLLMSLYDLRHARHTPQSSTLLETAFDCALRARRRENRVRIYRQ